MTRHMRELAGGNLETNVEFPDRDDEIREMAEALEVFRRSMIQVQELAQEQREHSGKRTGELHRARLSGASQRSPDLRPLDARDGELRA